MRAGEDMHVAAKSDHDLISPFYALSVSARLIV
jgi:hypothetical protein